jgi:Domain of unknown function (DUF4145)
MDPIEFKAWNDLDAKTLSMRCPSCRHVGVFQSQGKDDSGTAGSEYVGLGSRICPNPTCRSYVFVVYNSQSRSITITYPRETIDFDATNLPSPVLAALDEAIRCHAAGCYRASALLVRRSLEELCLDRSAKGSNLKEKLKSLSGRIAVAEALVEGFDTLRLLGNDAAHVELKDFDTIGSNEAGLAIEIVKELLKGVYQYDALVARLDALKKSTT